MTNLYIHAVEGTNWNASSYDVMRMLGHDDGRVPRNGFSPVRVQHIKVWAEPLIFVAGKHRHSKTHRLMAECPICCKRVSIGRLRQHSKVHTRGCFDNGSQ